MPERCGEIGESLFSNPFWITKSSSLRLRGSPTLLSTFSLGFSISGDATPRNTRLAINNWVTRLSTNEKKKTTRPSFFLSFPRLPFVCLHFPLVLGGIAWEFSRDRPGVVTGMRGRIDLTSTHCTRRTVLALQINIKLEASFRCVAIEIDTHFWMF